jgi:hypothetical protein
MMVCSDHTHQKDTYDRELTNDTTEAKKHLEAHRTKLEPKLQTMDITTHMVPLAIVQVQREATTFPGCCTTNHRSPCMRRVVLLQDTSHVLLRNKVEPDESNTTSAHPCDQQWQWLLNSLHSLPTPCYTYHTAAASTFRPENGVGGLAPPAFK